MRFTFARYFIWLRRLYFTEGAGDSPRNGLFNNLDRMKMLQISGVGAGKSRIMAFGSDAISFMLIRCIDIKLKL